MISNFKTLVTSFFYMILNHLLYQHIHLCWKLNQNQEHLKL